MKSDLSLSPQNPLEPQAAGGYSSPPVSAERPALRLWVRLGLAGTGAVLATLLVTAACLSPNPAGLGTHQQLGLPPCSMVQLLGFRCPACGMTTSWSHLLRGHVLASFEANAGGTLLGLTAMALTPWMWLSALRGRWFLGPPRDEVVLTVGVTIAAVTVVDWLVRFAVR